jgi:hypothetical protein
MSEVRGRANCGRRPVCRRSRLHRRTLHLGPEELVVGAKLAVQRQDCGHQIAAAIDAAEQRAREAVPGLRRGASDPVSWQHPRTQDL